MDLGVYIRNEFRKLRCLHAYSDDDDGLELIANWRDSTCMRHDYYEWMGLQMNVDIGQEAQIIVKSTEVVQRPLYRYRDRCRVFIGSDKLVLEAYCARVFPCLQVRYRFTWRAFALYHSAWEGSDPETFSHHTHSTVSTHTHNNSPLFVNIYHFIVCPALRTVILFSGIVYTINWFASSTRTQRSDQPPPHDTTLRINTHFLWI